MRKLVLLLSTLALTFGMVGVVSAGEITGTGKDTPIRDGVAASACAFSGLNDDTGFFEGKTQSYGQVVRMGFKNFAPSPGEACNPSRGGAE